MCICKGYIILSYQVRVWTLVNARRDDALFYEHVIEWCYRCTRAEPECPSTAKSCSSNYAYSRRALHLRPNLYLIAQYNVNALYQRRQIE